MKTAKEFRFLFHQCTLDNEAGLIAQTLAALEARERQVEALKMDLMNALEGLHEMFPYVPEYYRDKWNHQQYIDRARTALGILSAIAPEVRPSSHSDPDRKPIDYKHEKPPKGLAGRLGLIPDQDKWLKGGKP